jgi:hypothetical protein
MPPPLAAGTAHTRLADGELGFLAFRRLTLRTRQRGTDEAAVNRAFVVDGVDSVCLGWFGWLLLDGWCRRNKRLLGV